jgi:hypothetical protein
MWISYTAYPFKRPEILTPQQYVNLKSNPNLFIAGLTAMDEYVLKTEFGLKSEKGILSLLSNIGLVIFFGFIVLGMSGVNVMPFVYILPLTPILILIGHSSNMSKLSLKSRIRKTKKFGAKLVEILISTNDYEEFCEEYGEIGRIRLSNWVTAR